MNKQYLDAQSADFKTDYFVTALPEELKKLPQYSAERAARLQPAVFDRIHTKAEVIEAATAREYSWAFTSIDVPAAMLAWKNDPDANAAVPRLQKVLEILENADFSSPDTLKEVIWPYAEEVGKGEVLWPLRVSLTGAERSPDPFSCLHILEKEESMKRVKEACDKIEA